MGGRYALIIGNFNFEKYESLPFIEEYALKLKELFGDPRIGGYKVDLYNNTTEIELRKIISNFYSARESDDITLFYFLGHGDLYSGDFYFITKDSDPNDLYTYGIDTNYFKKILNTCESTRNMMIADCSYSGSFAMSMGGVGTYILASSSKYEAAWNANFSKKLIQGLVNGNADFYPNDGKIMISEMFQYVRKELKGQNQKPVTTFSGGGDYILAFNPKWESKPNDYEAFKGEG